MFSTFQTSCTTFNVAHVGPFLFVFIPLKDRVVYFNVNKTDNVTIRRVRLSLVCVCVYIYVRARLRVHAFAKKRRRVHARACM